jgi:hypothetical protein
MTPITGKIMQYTMPSEGLNRNRSDTSSPA